MESVSITIHWHDESQPIYLVAFQPSVGILPRLATAGGDSNVRLWRVSPLISGAVEYLSTLRKHTQAVNVVRFDSSGSTLASAGDDGSLILWKRSDTIKREFGEDEDDDDASELWIAKKILRNSTSEIYDICWSPQGDHIAAGAMDNSLRIYNLTSGKTTMIRDHTHYVQGVAWDPLGQFLVTQLADRSINVYRFDSNVEEPVLIHKSSRGVFENDRLRVLYHSETLQSFFRRLTFSPDGSLLLVPLGVYRATNDGEKNGKGEGEILNELQMHNIDDSEKSEKSEKSDSRSDSRSDQQEENAVYVYTRSNLKNPVCVLPGLSKPALVVAFSPIIYETKVSRVFDLPYKMVFAVATQDLIVLYSTDSIQPLGYTLNLHYLTITDILWNTDGQSLIASSTDGFCSLVTFKEGIFGRVTSLKNFEKHIVGEKDTKNGERDTKNGGMENINQRKSKSQEENTLNGSRKASHQNNIDSMLQNDNKASNGQITDESTETHILIPNSEHQDIEMEQKNDVIDKDEVSVQKDTEMTDNDIKIIETNTILDKLVETFPTIQPPAPAKPKKRVQPTLVSLTRPDSDC